MWQIEKLVSKGEYTYAVVKDHPNATALGYVFEHRIVMENELGRLLLSTEIVHHRDRNKKNNVPSNLEVMDGTEHSRMHGLEQGVCTCVLKCPHCDTIFERPFRQAFQTMAKRFGSFCTRSCSAKFSRKAQLHGLSNEMEMACMENIVEIYQKLPLAQLD